MNKIKTILVTGFLSLLLMTGVLTFVLPDQDFSEAENRFLEGKPSFSISAVLDGSFADKLSTYLSDQIPFRSALIRVETQLKLMCGKRDISDTYIGKDNYLFEKVTDDTIDSVRFERNLSLLESLADEVPDIPFTVMLVPSSGVILSDKLPSHADIYDAGKLIQTATEQLTGCRVVDPTALLNAHRQESLYYRTDHHWTTRGAYLGYLTITGREDDSADLRLDTVSTSFQGTLQSRVPGADTANDTIEIYSPTTAVSVSQDGKEIDLYDMKCLEEKDQYKVFLGGNYPRVDITGGGGTKSLLVIKDSFANSLVPFLTEDYAAITLIDPRYYSGSVLALLQSGAYDEVAVIYELNNFAGDSNLARLAP